MIVVGLAPGRNFGWCRMEIAENGKISVIGSDMLMRPIEKIPIGNPYDVDSFVREIRELCDDADLIVVEHYADDEKGGRKATGEIISFTVGVIVGVYDSSRIRLVTASEWKTAISKKYGCSMKNSGSDQHMVDAFCIGAYGGGVVVDARKVVRFLRRKR